MKNEKMTIKDISLIAMFSAVITVCAWLSLPIMTIPVTLQTFGVFLTLLLLGGRNGLLSILVYILLGLVGVPVFSGFKAGPSALFGPTGGYIVGFLFVAVIYIVFTHFDNKRLITKIVSLITGLAVCYIFGTVWFIFVYNSGDKTIGVKAALSLCVLPFILPDLIKLCLSVALYKLIMPAVKKATKSESI